MPSSIDDLFVHNRAWAAQMERERPGFFTSLLAQQKPKYMWIGCSDSRVPANQITGLEPGEVFVHRNVANVVVPTDLNCLSTIQYAVDQLQVEHLMVVGHYGCGGVLAALRPDPLPQPLDTWIAHVRAVRDLHRDHLATLTHERDKWYRLCELNVMEQVKHVTELPTVKDAWARGQPLDIHGWIYDLHDGLLKDLGVTVGNP